MKNNNKFDSIVDDIHQEYCSACKKHPHWPAKKVDSIAILNEEAGESIEALINLYGGVVDLVAQVMLCSKKSLEYQYNEGGTIEDLRKELVQTGAMVIRCLINLKENNEKTHNNP